MCVVLIQDDLYYHHTFIQDLLWDALNYCTEPLMRHWPLKMIRQKALDKAIKYMRYEAEETRYITIGCVEKVSPWLDIKGLDPLL